MSLLARAGYRHLLLHPWQLLLAVLGVTIGVAVVVAMDLGMQSAREAFRTSAETVAGSATHQVVGGATGVSDTLPGTLRRDLGLRAAAPVVEGYVLPSGRLDRPLRVLGIDPFSEAPFRPYLAGGPGQALDGSVLLTASGGAFLSRETARLLEVEEGDFFRVLAGGSERRLRAVGILDPGDELSRRGLRDLLVVDVSEAQDLLGRVGRLDRVDLLLPPGEEGERLRGRLEEALPAGARLEPAGTRSRALGSMIEAFDLNLRALSLLALLFGIFLIYSTMTFSVVQRRGTLGILRALGASRSQVMKAVLGEAAVLGLVGGVLGTLSGIALGRGLVRLVTRTINDLYFVVSVEGLTVPPSILLKGLVLGIAAAVVASIPAAREAIRVQPREAMARASLEDRARRMIPRSALLGFGFLGLGLLVLVPDAGVGPAFAGLFLVVVGLASLTPAATVLMTRVLRPPLRLGFGVVGGMAARSVVTALSRTGPAMVALVIAVAVSVGLGVMIQSFRGSVEAWLDDALRADLYVSTPSLLASRPDGRLPEGLPRATLALPGVARVDASRSVRVFLDDDPVHLLVGETLTREGASQGDEISRPLLAAADARASERFRDGEGVLVSEPYSVRRGVAPGDSVVLPGEDGPITLPILGVYRDYSSETGTVRLTRETYDRHWTDPNVTSLAVHLEEDAGEDAVEAAIREVAGAGVALEIRPNRALRAASLEVFDRTFAITRVLRGLALVVAFIAVLSALMALQLERGRELAVLRANGMTPAQTWRLVTVQTGLMGTLAGVLALPVGLILAGIMIRVVNRRSFGWSMEMQAGPDLFVQALLLSLVGALAAGLYPSWRMSRAAPAASLRGE